MKCRLAMRVFVHFLNRTPQVADMVTGWNKTIEFDLDGERPFHIIVRDKRASLVAGKPERPDVIFSAPSRLFLQMLTGEVNADEAFMSKKYDVRGAPGDATRFRVLGERVQEYHPRSFSLLLRLAYLGKAPRKTSQP